MDEIYFTVNGNRYSLLGSKVSLSTSLNDYIRNHLHLHGTKAMCHEGGCGSCMVTVVKTHPVTKERQTFGVNSCLVSILSCQGWDITTIEGIGSWRDGYHAVQRRLAAFNGTQCGYCSPGMVMNMYSLTKKDKMTMQDIENSFGSNICRCTGYRPILDAFKTFGSDLKAELKEKLEDVEDLHKIKCLKNCTKPCIDESDDWCLIETDDRFTSEINANDGKFYKAYSIPEVFQILAAIGNESHKLISGNTGQGVYPTMYQPEIIIDISSIETLKHVVLDENLTIGSGVTLSELFDIFHKWSNNSDFSYFSEFNKHMDLVAHIAVKNLASVGGNLAIKNLHNSFPSDIFILLATVGAMITILNKNLRKSLISMEDFLKVNLNHKIIFEVKLPPLSPSNLVKTYKIMSRAQNTHAIVNAGFLYKIDDNSIVEATNIVFGHINPDFTTAYKTVSFLKGQPLFSEKTLQVALKILAKELKVVELLPEPSPECRKAIALGLFYKSILFFSPKLNARYKSGAKVLERGLSRGKQVYDTDKKLWPLNEPVLKLEGLSQCSGEVKYSCDIATESRSVQVALVLSKICKGDIVKIDPSDALSLPGVIGFFTAADIPGKNTCTPKIVPLQFLDTEILATKVSYYGQPIAVVAASTRELAITAASLVNIEYKESDEKPVLNIRDALKAADKDRRVHQECDVKSKDKGTDVDQILKGSFSSPPQYHYHMETQSCTVSHTPRGIRIRSSTQWMDMVQVAVADALEFDHNQVEVEVPRVGGAYGAKISSSAKIACCCALVAYKLDVTATLILPIADNMEAIGKRQMTVADYEVGINKEGRIQYLNLTTYTEAGYAKNDTVADLSPFMGTLYDTSRWNIKGNSVLTDKASNTWCRAPGTTDASAITEHIMERIAHAVKKDPTEIRIMHLTEENKVMTEIIETFKNDCNFDERQEVINNFNKDNAWRKKALKLSIMAFPIVYMFNFPVTVSVYHGDGTVTISHGGIEMGQGINTKVAQVCAYTLKIPLDKITVKGSDTFTSPNSMGSGGSMASDSVAYATVKACEELLKRLEPVKKELTDPAWPEIIKAAFDKGINLQTSYMMSSKDSLKKYVVYGVCASEVELDVLTGTHIVRRVDLMEDTGISMSPEIDVGQIEGAFVMGLGLWTSEHLVYDQTTGKLLTNRTWTYKVPGAKDIPEDFRISFRRNSPNAAGVLRSKATGEPALVLAVSVAFALHDAILEARKEFGYNDTDWVHIDTPYNVENIMKGIAPKYEYFKLQ